MRILHIYRVFTDNIESSGVNLKRQDQIEAFKNMGHEVCPVYLRKNGLWQNEIIKIKKKFRNKIQQTLYKHISFYKDLQKTVIPEQFDLVYIRYGLSHKSFIDFLEFLIVRNGLIKIIIEIPTFPYKHEYSGLLGRILLLRDKYYRLNLNQGVDKIVDFGCETRIFGIPCVNVQNGINVCRIPKRRKIPAENQLRLIAVGKLWKWFGLDRIIKGIGKYYYSVEERKVDISLNIIGLGPDMNYLKKLVESYGLEERIKFFGNKEGIELDNLFNESDLGIGTMAIHRKKVKYSSSLKHREYVLRGIPLLLSGEDRGLLNYEEIILKVEENDSPIDIYNLISKFNVLNSNYVENSLRRKAEKDLGWEGQLRKVLESF